MDNFIEELKHFVRDNGPIEFNGRWIYDPAPYWKLSIFASVIVEIKTLYILYMLMPYIGILLMLCINVAVTAIIVRILFKHIFTYRKFAIHLNLKDNFYIQGSKDDLVLEITSFRDLEAGLYRSRYYDIKEIKNLHPKNIKLLEKAVFKKLNKIKNNDIHIENIADKLAIKRELSKIAKEIG
jgi:hypothetical protein